MTTAQLISELEKLYLEEKLSTGECAKRIGVKTSKARQLMLENNIPIRPKGFRTITDEERLWNSVIPEPNSGCWLWLRTIKSNGYGAFRFRGKTFIAHRASWEIHRGPIPENLQVLHRCDTPSCANPYHLFLGTQRDNMQDCLKKGRLADQRGEKHNGAVLTNSQVREIRILLKTELTQPDIAKQYGVSRSAIKNIKDGSRWKHI